MAILISCRPDRGKSGRLPQPVDPLGIAEKEAFALAEAPRVGQCSGDGKPFGEAAGHLADGPVAAEEDALRAEGIGGLPRIPEEILRLPSRPIRLGREPGNLA